MAELLQCPFCSFSDRDSYFLMLHVEELHTDDSPFVARDNNSPPYAPSPSPSGKQPFGDSPSQGEGESDWVLCPAENCGEQVPLHELNDHLDLHLAETLEYQEAAGISSSSSSPVANMRSPSTIASEHSFSGNSFSTQSTHHARTRLPSDGSEKTTLTRSFLDIIKPSSPSKKRSGSRPSQSGRLGKSELGPYAFEEQMPAWLYRQIEAGPKVTVANRIGRDGRIIKVEEVDNETPGILPVLAQLCSIDRGVSRAYLCHPSTVFITKRQNEGGFCGYRNTQMLVSYIRGSKAQGHDKFGSRTPGILLLQDLIEEAWDKGINSVSRTQTGGIRGTRKYIGTPEVEALLRSLGIDHGLQMFTDRPNNQAHEQLLNDVESYFEAAVEDDENIKVHKTHLPPIYLQQPGHSITIVGFERLKDGTRNLLVFDPMFRTSPGMHRILGRKDLRTHRPEILQAYRRGARQLSRHRDFEMIKLTAHPPLFPAWDVISIFPECPYLYVFFHAPTLDYHIIPEHCFTVLFPWQSFGALFSVQDARFASTDTANNTATDSGLLGGMPVLLDKTYLEWMKPTAGPDSVCAIKTTNTISSHPSYIAAYLETHQGEELPEDVYFEKSVDTPVAIHYACGMPFRPGYIHHAFKRCQAPNSFKRYNNSESSSSTISIPGRSNEDSPTSPRPPFASGAHPPSKYPEKRLRPLSPRAAGWPFAPTPQAQSQQHCLSPPVQPLPSPSTSVCSISGVAEGGNGELTCQHCAYAARYADWLYPQMHRQPRHERRDSGIGCTPESQSQVSAPALPVLSLQSPAPARTPSLVCQHHQQSNLPYRTRQDSQDQYSSDYQQVPSRRRWSQATNSTVTSTHHQPSGSATVPDQLEDFFYEMGSDGRQAVFYGTGSGMMMHKGKEVRNARTCGNWRDS